MISAPEDGVALKVGDEVELEIGAVAHGGVCVARHDGRVVFVRYALPGERALVRITDAKKGSFCRGDVVKVVRADARRVAPPCVHFGPGGCGGCDWQHAPADLQRELKAAVVAEQLHRLAGLDVTVAVEPLPGGEFGWRTRVRWAVAALSRPGAGESVRPDAAVGPRRYRSHAVVPITGDAPCLIAPQELSESAAALAERRSGAADEWALVDRGTAPPVVVGVDAPPVVVTERVGDRAFDVDAAGFWQAHRHAAETFCGAVAELLAGVEVTGGVAWDLYGGVGLFAPVLAAAVGESGEVITVESDRRASSHARTNLVDLTQVRAVHARVDRFVAADRGALDVALLDPPRSGAGTDICRGIAARRPALVVYVACDPAALARDTATLLTSGYRLASLRAFDAFPQTHHVECIVGFVPAGSAHPPAGSAHPPAGSAHPPAGSAHPPAGSAPTLIPASGR